VSARSFESTEAEADERVGATLRRFMAYPVISMPARVVVASGVLAAALVELLRAMAYAVTSNPDRRTDAIGVNLNTCWICMADDVFVCRGRLVVLLG